MAVGPPAVAVALVLRAADGILQEADMPALGVKRSAETFAAQQC